MSVVIPIPARTIPVGVSIFGPVAPGAGVAAFVLSLESGNLTPQMTLVLELALDGINWQEVGQDTYQGPTRNRAGTIVPLTFWVNIGNTADGPILTTGASLVRLTITNTSAFATAGGSITLM